MSHIEQHEDTPAGFVALLDWTVRIVATILGVAAVTMICLSLERVS